MYKFSRSTSQSGYVLVATILLGFAIAIASSTFLQYVVSSSTQMTNDTYTRLADEAAEAGAVYAADCIGQYSGNWNAFPNGVLQPNTACDGTTKGSQNVSTSQSGSYQWITTFAVAPYAETNDNYKLSVTGTLTIMRGSTTIKTYTSVKTSLLSKYIVRASITPATEQQATSLSVDTHSCLIANGQLYCWGDNTRGQLGMAAGDTTSRNTPTKVPFFASKTVTKVAVGFQNTCAVADGTLYCWGDNTYGQVGVNSIATSYYTTPQTVDMTNITTAATTNKRVTDLSLTQSTTTPGSACIIVDGSGYCWGRNNNQQLGFGNTAATYRPTKLTAGDISGRIVLDISVGDIGGCAITSTVSTTTASKYPLVCWGMRAPGQGAVAPTAGTQAALNWASDAVAVTGKTTCTTLGAFFYGLACYGQSNALTGLGTSTMNTVYSFNGYTPLPAVSSLDSGVDGSDELYCIVAVHRPWCAGTANRGLAPGDPVDPYGSNGIPFAMLDSPFDLNTRGNPLGGIFHAVSTIGAGNNYGCFLSNGSLFCWGKDTNGQLGDNVAPNTIYVSPQRIIQNNIGGQADLSTPTVANTNDFRWTLTADGPLSLGNRHACAIIDAYIMCWGANDKGQLGTGNYQPSYRPITSGALVYYGADKISAGGDSTCAVAGGALFCWGDNTNGKLGIGSTSPSMKPSPTQLPFFADATNISNYGYVKDVSVGSTNACAITGTSTALSGNTVFCWGKNDHRQVGVSGLAATDQPTPKQVTGLPTNGTVTAISVGDSHACAIVNGDMYCWGTNGSYQLGYKTSTTDQYATKVNATGTFTAVTASKNFTCGILNGAAVCWGVNTSGQTGVAVSANRIPASLPITIANSSVSSLLATDIKAGDSHVCAVLQGATYCWGDNTKGQIGNGTTTSPVIGPYLVNGGAMAPSAGNNMTTPVTIGAGAGGFTSCNVANGLINCWGNNGDLQAGKDTTNQGQTAPDPTSTVLSPLTAQWYRYEAARNKGTFY